MSTDWSLYTRWEYARTRQTSQFGSAKVKKKIFDPAEFQCDGLASIIFLLLGLANPKQTISKLEEVGQNTSEKVVVKLDFAAALIPI